jgi:hypothetical protein
MPRTDDSLLGHIRCTHSNVLLQTFAVATTPVSWLLPARQTTQPISTQTTASPTAPSRFCRHTKRWESALLAALSSTRWDSCDLIWIGRRRQVLSLSLSVSLCLSLSLCLSVSVCLVRPHLDWSSLTEFWAHYPVEKCAKDVAKYKTAPTGSPKIAWVDGGYADHKEADCGRDCPSRCPSTRRTDFSGWPADAQY